jgi:hypothetical protein
MERTVITWRREQMSATMRFLDALDALDASCDGLRSAADGRRSHAPASMAGYPPSRSV